MTTTRGRMWLAAAVIALTSCVAQGPQVEPHDDPPPFPGEPGGRVIPEDCPEVEPECQPQLVAPP